MLRGKPALEVINEGGLGALLFFASFLLSTRGGKNRFALHFSSGARA
jgi:hypothetical protein